MIEEHVAAAAAAATGFCRTVGVGERREIQFEGLQSDKVREKERVNFEEWRSKMVVNVLTSFFKNQFINFVLEKKNQFLP